MPNLNEIIDTKEKFLALLVVIVAVLVFAAYGLVKQAFKRWQKGKAMPDDDSKPRKMGCAILFVPTLIVIDTLGMAASSAGRYGTLAFAVGLVGCVCGAALGGYIAAKAGPKTKWSPSFWVAIGGLVGLILPFGIALYVAQFCLR